MSTTPTIVELSCGTVAYLEEGSGPALICLHGFPDTPRSFRHQLSELSRAGYRVIAPYMRGYAPSTVAGPYQPARVALDVVALMDALGLERASLLGHDWGAMAAYSVALAAPTRVDKLVASAVPYGAGVARALVLNGAQQRRSWYMFFFQSRIADLAVPMADYAFIDALWSDWSPGLHPPEDVLSEVKRCLASPGGLEAALGYYRTMLDPSLRDPALSAEENRYGSEAIAVPTLYVHGAIDGCIGVDVTEGAEAMFTAGYRAIVVKEAGHFVHLEQPEAVNAAILAFLRG